MHLRIRLIGAGRQPTRLAPIVQPIFTRLSEISSVSSKVPSFLPKTIHLPITTGSNFIFWSWLCIAFSDVGGYFAGRRFGKTKLSAISPAAGKTSPNKTVEGVVGGCVFSVILATLGAWIQKWPYWSIVGPIHGVSLALLGLLGDLTASMLKRDAGLKDFGDFIPEHGGIMDRVDSYVSFVFFHYQRHCLHTNIMEVYLYFALSRYSLHHGVGSCAVILFPGLESSQILKLLWGTSD